MTPIDAPKSASALDVAELPSTQTERLRVIAKWFVGQHLVEAAACLLCAADTLEQQAAEIVEQRGYAQKYVNERIVLNGKLAEQSARLQELGRDAARYRWLTDPPSRWYVQIMSDLMDREPKICVIGRELSAAIDAAIAADAAGGEHD
jgi:hypothetical protein